MTLSRIEITSPFWRHLFRRTRYTVQILIYSLTPSALPYFSRLNGVPLSKHCLKNIYPYVLHRRWELGKLFQRSRWHENCGFAFSTQSRISLASVIHENRKYAKWTDRSWVALFAPLHWPIYPQLNQTNLKFRAIHQSMQSRKIDRSPINRAKFHR